ncbi:MAG: carbohydrate kinase family protein [Desulfurococcaceae archaeon]
MATKNYVHVSVGNFNVDIVVYVDALPKPDEGLFAREVSLRPGGAATNYAVAVASYGHTAYLVASVSTDHFIRSFLREVERLGVKTDHLYFVDESPGFVVVLVKADGERAMIRYQGANKHLDPSYLSDTLLKQAHLVHFASVHPSFVQNSIKRVKMEPIIVSYDPGPFATDVLNYPDVVGSLDLLFLNESEYAKIKSKADLRSFFKIGLKILNVKMGSKGAISIEAGDRCYHGVAKPIRKPVDTTGAGDAFDAFFNATYLETGDVTKSLLFGVAAGTYKTGCKGSFILWDPDAFKYQLERATVVKRSCKDIELEDLGLEQ